MPRATVIIPCHNAEPYLGEAIDSCLAQTERDVEVLVVDDGSTDGSAAIARDRAAADPRVRVLSQPNRGVGLARNAALAVARGSYVAFLDADDVYEPEKIARQADVLDRNPDLGLVLCDGSIIDAAGAVVWEGLVDPRRLVDQPPLFELCFAGGPFPPLVPLLRTEIARAAGGFDPDPAACGWADIGFWMRVGLLGTRYHFLADRLVRYRTTPTNMSANRDAMEEAARRIYARVMTEHPEASARALRIVHGRLADLGKARDQLRSLVDTLLAEREAVAVERDAAAAEREALRAERDGLAHAHATLADAHTRLHGAHRDLSRTALHLLALGRQAAGSRPVAIWGAGAAGRRLLAAIRHAGGRPTAFVDSNPDRGGTRLDGVSVITPGALAASSGPKPFVAVASLYSAEITERLREMGWQSGTDYLVADVDLVLQLDMAAPVDAEAVS